MKKLKKNRVEGLLLFFIVGIYIFSQKSAFVETNK